MGKLEQFAQLKRLPVGFLIRCDVKDVDGKIRFGNENARVRFRKAVETTKDNFLWADDGKPQRAYGYHYPENTAPNSSTLLLVEGESDALTAWFHGRPALGIPGATMAKLLEREDVERFKRVVVIREHDESGAPDQGGKVFPGNVEQRLRELQYAGAIVVSDLPVKDLSALHVKHADDATTFVRILDESISTAQPINAARIRHDGDEPEWDETASIPVLGAAARYGFVGEILAAVEEQTEAHPAAILFTILAAIGNAAGPGVYARVGSEHHPARLSAVVVADTGTGKGQSLALVRPIFQTADPAWWNRAYCSGFNSGEGLIARLSGEHDVEGDAPEKRAFIVEPEFVRVLSVNKRDGSTLSAIARQAWDSGRLQITMKGGSLLVDDAHVSLVGHITPQELQAKLIGSDLSNGFANRLLFVHAHRARRLPSGGYVAPATYEYFARRVGEALVLGPRELRRTPEADTLWDELYNAEPEPGGLLGAVTGRSAAQRLRLAVAYAILDSSFEIRREHVEAAEAAWRYCYASALYIFGSVLADPIESRILDELRDSWPDGIDGNELRDLWSGHKPASTIKAACDALEKRGLIRSERIPTEGRSRIVRYACAKSALSVESSSFIPITALNTLNAQGYQPILDEGELL